MTLAPSMGRPFLLCSLAFMGLFAVLLAARVRLQNVRATVDELYLSIED
jgi:hypothetical protein